ncbi:aldehyde dehydrogenase family protein [Streptomyces sp. PTM05]|uniref:Aldehyde dehydrogenase family protein n=1 Tax=Streptantibioticus parmotrematis TaxID=2873249 RepID=A0ABS7QTQ2_9ACTN|nr:aldehyde dehydrogenase family protein [Streptantibioticus parmotrematis]MBY8886111.1 aldehyde dehydrogenase family protein [Streptantibioticus parmotrematis]
MPDPCVRVLLGRSLARALAQAGVEDARGTFTPVTGVFSGRPLVSVPVCGPRDVRATVSRAEGASWWWGATSVHERLRWVRCLGRALGVHRTALVAVLTESCGLGPADAHAECLHASRIPRAHARAALLGPRSAPDASCLSLLRRAGQPFVVFSSVDAARPLASLLEGALPALLSGVAVVTVVDHRSAVPALAAVMAARGAGLPRHVWQLSICGPEDEDLAALRSVLAEHTQGAVPQCCQDLVSPRRRAPGLLVLRHDGNVRAAARGALTACFGRAGRGCAATPLVLVHTSLLPAFLADLSRRLACFTPVSALPERGQSERLASWTRGVIDGGADVVWPRAPHPALVIGVPRPLLLLAPGHAASPPTPPTGPASLVVRFSAWSEALDVMRRGGPHLSVYTRTSRGQLWPQFASLPAAHIALNRPSGAGLPPGLPLAALRSL